MAAIFLLRRHIQNVVRFEKDIYIQSIKSCSTETIKRTSYPLKMKTDRPLRVEGEHEEAEETQEDA